MLDKKSTAVLRALSKLTEGTAYKVVTSEDILMCLNQKSQYDVDSIKQIMDFLEKQEYINIKFYEDDTYCYSLLPKARICLEHQNTKTPQQKKSLPVVTYVFVMMASFVGTMLAMLIFFYLNF